MHYKLKSSLQQTLLVTGALLTAANLASGQIVKKNLRNRAAPVQGVELKPGEIILMVKPGTAQADVTRLSTLAHAAQTNALLLDNTYQLILDAAHADQASTAAIVAQLKMDPSVYSVRQAIIYQLFSATTTTPNDPRYKSGEQWGHAIINMPQAWTLQKGNINTYIAIMDTGFMPTHEDAPLFAKESFNAADGTKNITFNQPPGGATENDHGVGTSGVIAAHTNNNVGIAGIVWNQVPVLAIKAYDTTNSFSNAAILNGYAFVAKNAAALNITALNLSYGADQGAVVPLDPTDPDYVGLQAVYNAGVVVCASKGNEGSPLLPPYYPQPSTVTPADYPFVIAVSAIGPDPTQLAGYSNWGKVEIAAPGGNSILSGIQTQGILGLTGDGGYGWHDGTSNAAPYVTGVVGLLRSVPGVTQAKAIDALESQANSKITGQLTVPDNHFGYGLLDAYASLAKVSNVIDIQTPIGVDPTTGQPTSGSSTAPAPLETLRPTVQLHMTNVSVVKGVPQYTVSVASGTGTTVLINNGVINPAASDANGSLVSDLYVVNNSIGTFAQYDISFRYRATDSPVSQQQQLTATSTPSDPTLASVTSAVQFNITPYTFPSGLSMISFPVVETAGDSPNPTIPNREINDLLDLTGTSQTAVLYRWVNASTVDATGKPNVQGQYAISGSGAGNNLPQYASLHPTDVTTVPTPAIAPTSDPTNPNNTITNANPAGLAYFINLSSGAAVRTFGRTFDTQTMNVPIHEGWNMIGDPFDFPIAFSNLAIKKSDGTLLNAPQAATANLILPFIYRFVGGSYVFQTLPNGTLYPWDGNWIYVVPATPGVVDPNTAKYTLVISPTQAGNPIAKATTAANRNPLALNRGASALNVKPTVHGPGSWSLRLAAQTATGADTYNFIGMSSDATPLSKTTRAPKPPKITGDVALGITAENSSALYAQDLRSLGGTQTWNIQVKADKPNTLVNVTWPDIHTLPRNYQLTLADPTSGQSIDLRSRSVYQFNSGATAAARNLTITVTPATIQDTPTFENVVVTPRSNGKGTAAIYQIDYNLTGTAQVDVAILGTGGRVISTVDTGRAIASGSNHVTWNGHDNQNRTVATGAYQVRLRAVSATGKVRQVLAPLTITR